MRQFLVIRVENADEFEHAMEQAFVDGWQSVAYFCSEEPHPNNYPCNWYTAYLTREQEAEAS